MAKITKTAIVDQAKLAKQLFTAVRRGKTERYNVLIGELWNINVREAGTGDTLFIAASAHGRLTIVQDLWRRSADANKQNREGLTAFGACLRNGSKRNQNGGHPLVEHFLLHRIRIRANMKDLRFKPIVRSGTKHGVHIGEGFREHVPQLGSHRFGER